MKRKITAFILCVAMLVSLFPLGAAADAGTDYKSDGDDSTSPDMVYMDCSAVKAAGGSKGTLDPAGFVRYKPSETYKSNGGYLSIAPAKSGLYSATGDGSFYDYRYFLVYYRTSDNARTSDTTALRAAGYEMWDTADAAQISRSGEWTLKKFDRDTFDKNGGSAVKANKDWTGQFIAVKAFETGSEEGFLDIGFIVSFRTEAQADAFKTAFDNNALEPDSVEFYFNGEKLGESSSFDIVAGADAAITCKVLPDYATLPKSAKLTYTAAPEGIVSVDSEGNITVLGSGEVTLTARAEWGGNSESVSFRLTTAAAESLTINASDPLVLRTGEEFTLVSTLKPGDATVSCAYTVDNAEVARVENGKLIALAVGECTLKAEFANVSTSIKVAVVDGAARIYEGASLYRALSSSYSYGITQENSIAASGKRIVNELVTRMDGKDYTTKEAHNEDYIRFTFMNGELAYSYPIMVVKYSATTASLTSDETVSFDPNYGIRRISDAKDGRMWGISGSFRHNAGNTSVRVNIGKSSGGNGICSPYDPTNAPWNFAGEAIPADPLGYASSYIYFRAYKGKTMTVGDKLDIEYIGFFKNEAEADAYVAARENEDIVEAAFIADGKLCGIEKVASGTCPNVPELTKRGYRVEWKNAAGEIVDPASLPLTSAAVYYGEYVRGDLTVDAHASFDGSITKDGAPLEGKFTVKPGTSVTLKAVPDADYRFEGWYDINNHRVSGEAEYTFTVNDNIYLEARFCTETVITYSRLVAFTDSALGDLAVNGVPSGNYFNSYVANRGTVTLTALPNEGARALFWTRVTDTAESLLAFGDTLEAVPLGSEVCYKPYFAPSDEACRVYLDYTGELLGVNIEPTLPKRKGYTASGFVFEREENGVQVYTPDYRRDGGSHTLTVNYADGEVELHVTYDGRVKLSAKSENFVRFDITTENGTSVLSYNREYDYYHIFDTDITVTEITSGEAETASVATLDNTFADGKSTFAAAFSLADGLEPVERGVLVTRDPYLATPERMILGAAGIIEGRITKPIADATPMFAVTRKDALGGYFGRAYIVYRENGELKTMYAKEILGEARDYKVSDYILPEADSTIGRAKELQSDKRASILFVTDLHNGNSERVRTGIHNTVRSFNIMNDSLRLDYAVYGGDYLSNNASTTLETCAEQLGDLVSEINGTSLPSFMLRGNHDSNPFNKALPLTDRSFYEQTNALINKGEDFVPYIDSNGKPGNAGYVDLNDSKLRLIFVNTTDVGDTGNGFGMTEDQSVWFATEALNFMDKSDRGEWAVLLFAHNYFTATSFSDVSVSPKLHAVLTAFADGAPSAYFDYSDQGEMEVVGALVGHWHEDRDDLIDGVRIICTKAASLNDLEDKTPGTADETAYDIVTVDRESRKIYLTRFGYGDDRIFTY